MPGLHREFLAIQGYIERPLKINKQTKLSGLPGTKSACLCLSSVGTKGGHPYCLASFPSCPSPGTCTFRPARSFHRLSPTALLRKQPILGLHSSSNTTAFLISGYTLISILYMHPHSFLQLMFFIPWSALNPPYLDRASHFPRTRTSLQGAAISLSSAQFWMGWHLALLPLQSPPPVFG